LREPGASDNHIPELSNGDPLGRVEFKDTLKDGVQLWRHREDRPKKLGIFHVGTESAVIERRTLPWVSSTSEVHQDDSETPDVVGRRSIT
jgi:hypothetical protein